MYTCQFLSGDRVTFTSTTVPADTLSSSSEQSKTKAEVFAPFVPIGAILGWSFTLKDLKSSFLSKYFTSTTESVIGWLS